MSPLKPIAFRGSSLADLRRFPTAARQSAGHQIDRLQHGSVPNDWRPMTTIGPGAGEIRIRDKAGAFLVIYVAKLVGYVYILHCFQKKTQQTSKTDLDLAKQRYQELQRELSI